MGTKWPLSRKDTMNETLAASGESFLTDLNFWNGVFPTGMVIAVILGLMIGQGFFRKIWCACLVVFIWCLIYWPIVFIGGLWGEAAESFAAHQSPSAAASAPTTAFSP